MVDRLTELETKIADEARVNMRYRDALMDRLAVLEETQGDMASGYDQFDADAIRERLSKAERHLSEMQVRLGRVEGMLRRMCEVD